MPLEVVVACLFAVVSGVNDGGALLATGLKLPTVRPIVGVLTLVLLTALVPLVSQQVAHTFVTRLASFEGPGATRAMTIAVLSAIAVVMALSHHGRPTSLTLAIVGGLTGAGLGWGLEVSAGSVALVLAVGLAAPFAGALAAWATTRLLVAMTTSRGLRRWHWAGFVLQCVAYAANDGQKMLAVFLVAVGSSGPSVSFAAAALFGLGTMYGMPRAGRTLGREILASRPLHGVAAELASGTTVIGCAAVGMPVSMTQSIAGSLIGSGVAYGGGRVRWYAAVKILIAWVLTLPAAGLLAAVAAITVKGPS
ncbi:inorganic phosphate transporter [Nonomuraea dietziae]|uniref:inorganic phosphate transporter n=1 Tax=Nonomuraea dietziae TaxID=65515 RepID=UPI0033F6D46B